MPKQENANPRRQIHYHSSLKMEAMIARLQYIGEHVFSGNRKAYAKTVGISKSRLNRILSFQGRFSVSIFLRFVESGIAAAEWLFCGTGPMHGRPDKLDDTAGYIPAPMESRHPLFDVFSAAPFLPKKIRRFIAIKPGEPDAVMQCLPMASCLFEARAAGNPVVLFLDETAMRAGVTHIALELMRLKYVTAVSLTASAAGLDYSAAKEHAYDNNALQQAVFSAARTGLGFGAGVAAFGFGKNDNRARSIMATGHDLGVPIMVHAAIGSDIAHAGPALYGPEYGAAIGATSYVDLLVFIAHMQRRTITAPSLLVVGGEEAVFARQLLHTAVVAGAGPIAEADFSQVHTGLLSQQLPACAFTHTAIDEYEKLFPAFLTACHIVYEGGRDEYEHKHRIASKPGRRSSRTA
jgi:hypothetical protein